MARDVADLLSWTYRHQRAHVVIERGAGLFGVEAAMDGVRRQGDSACGVALMEAIGAYGARIDGGGMSSGALHEDAEAVHAVVRRQLVAPLLINHALIGDCPDWLPGAVARLEAVRDARGRPLRAYEPWDHGRNWGWCLLTTRITEQRIAQQREEYAQWHAGLVAVARNPALRTLKLWRVTGPIAKKMPWRPVCA